MTRHAFPLVRLITLAVLAWAALAVPAWADTGAPPSSVTAYIKNVQSDSFTGMASLSIPIETLPGGPALSLNYSSGAVDEKTPREQANWVGLGWSLGGLGSIHKDRDGKFYLSMAGVSSVLTEIGAGEYRTQTNLFFKIIHSGSPDYWWLKTKDGTFYRFGYNADSKWTPNSGQEWFLDQIKDTNGNTTKIDYISITDSYCSYRDSGGNCTMASYVREVVPNTIIWNYQNDVLQGQRKIVFGYYTNRTDFDNPVNAVYGCGYCGAPDYTKKSYLSSIGVYFGVSRVRLYAFAYDYSTDTDPSRAWAGGATGDLTLKSVTLKGSDATTALPPVTFSYTNNRLSSVDNNGLGGSSQITYAEIPDAPTGPTQGALEAFASYAGQANCGNFTYYRSDTIVSSAVGTADIFASQYQTAEFATSSSWCGVWPCGCGSCNAVSNIYMAIYLTDGTHDVPLIARSFDMKGNTPAFNGLMKLVKRNDSKIDVYLDGNIINNISYPYSVAKLKLYTTYQGITGCGNGQYYGGYGKVNTGPATASFKGRYVAKTITTNDGLGLSGTTSYAYATPYFASGAYSCFAGFEKVTITDPAGNKSITHYHQGDGSPAADTAAWIGKVNYSITGGGDLDESNVGTFYKKIEYIYMYTAYGGDAPPYSHSNPPFFDPIYDVLTYTYDHINVGKYNELYFGYDSFGNIITTLHYSGSDVNYGYSRTVNEYNNDTSNWIFKLRNSATFCYAPGTSWTWTKYREFWNYYDNAAYGSFGNPARANLTKTEAWLSGGTNVTNTFSYDSYGNVISKVDGNGNTTSIAFDSTYHTYVTSITDAKGLVTNTGYDALMRPISVTDPNGQVTGTSYDVFGRVSKVWRLGDTEASPTYSYGYNRPATPPSSVIVVAKDGTADGQMTYTYYDGLGRRAGTATEAQASGWWVRTNTDYDSRGLVAAESVPYLEPGAWWRDTTQKRTTYTYDPLGRLTATTSPDGTRSTLSYAPQQVTATDALGHQKVSLFDSYGRVTQVQEKNGGATYYTNYTYIPATGELVKIVDQRNATWTNIYDTLGRKTRMSDPDMGTWYYTYDANGNLVTQTDAKNQTITMTYNAVNQITNKNYPDGSKDQFTYGNQYSDGNTNGRIWYVIGRNGDSKTWWYDGRGRITTELLTLPTGGGYNSWYTNFTYDSLDRVLSVTYPGGNHAQLGEVVNYTYNAQGLLQSVGGTSTYLSSANYNAFNRLTDQTFGNNIKTTYDYYDTSTETDPSNGGRAFSYRLRNLSLSGGTTNYEMNLTYRYDAVGNIKNILDSVHTGVNQSFGYDDLNRLTSATGYYGSKTYTYDPVGNITGKDGGSFSYIGTSHRGSIFSYDSNGNQITGIDKIYDYDYENRLTSVLTSSYQTLQRDFYDYSGTRIKRLYPPPNNTATSGSTNYYINQYYEERDGVAYSYYYANGQRIASRKQGIVTYIHSDHLGSTSRTSNSSGAGNGAIISDPWGQVSTGSVPINYTYNSKEKDQFTNLYYYGARFYDNLQGRFLTPDSVVQNPYDPQMLNRYAYVRNNPVRLTDPTGHVVTYGVDGNPAGGYQGSLPAGVSGSTGGSDSGGSYFLDQNDKWVYFPGIKGGFTTLLNALEANSSERKQDAQRWEISHTAIGLKNRYKDKITFDFGPGGEHGMDFGFTFKDAEGGKVKLSWGKNGLGLQIGINGASATIYTDGKIKGEFLKHETSLDRAQKYMKDQADLRVVARNPLLVQLSKYATGYFTGFGVADAINDAVENGNGFKLFMLNPEFSSMWNGMKPLLNQIYKNQPQFGWNNPGQWY